MKKVSVIGHFGSGHIFLDGQTVKTKIITEELQRQLGQEQVMRIDTHGGWKSLLKAPLQVLRGLKNSKNVAIFPAQNGLRVYAPLLSALRRFYRGRKLHYVVIGGWLPRFLAGRKGLSKALKRFDGIYVETQTMKTALEEQGFDNIIVLPNCKKLTVLTPETLTYPTEMPYKLCTFSRVMKEKGIEDAVRAVETTNKELGRQAFALDIYGQIDAGQSQWFSNLQQAFPAYIQYGGLVPFDKSVDVLKDYFALLFPTYYEGEGFAGTLIDAYSAGVPVIATDWRYNAELVTEDTGWVYPTGNQAEFVAILKATAQNPAAVLEKKTLCLREAEKYSIDKVVRILIDKLTDKQ